MLPLPFAIALPPYFCILLVPRCMSHITHSWVSLIGSASSPSQLQPLLPFFRIPMLPPYHPILIILGCMLRTTHTCLRYGSCSGSTTPASSHRSPVTSPSLSSVPLFLDHAKCSPISNALHVFFVPPISQFSPLHQLATVNPLSTPRGLPTMLILPSFRCQDFPALSFGVGSHPILSTHSHPHTRAGLSHTRQSSLL